MSSPPEPRTFEGWIEEDWPGATKRADVMALLEPYREAVTLALDDFDDEEQSWRDYCGRIYGWGDGPNDQGAVPDAVQKKVSEMMSREPEPSVVAKGGAPNVARSFGLGAPVVTSSIVQARAIFGGQVRDALDACALLLAERERLQKRIAELEATLDDWKDLAIERGERD